MFEVDVEKLMDEPDSETGVANDCKNVDTVKKIFRNEGTLVIGDFHL